METKSIKYITFHYYFTCETYKIKNIYFNNANLRQAQFFKTSLKNIDLSNSQIEGIAISLEDIKGAIIDQIQAIDLLYLIGVKIKQ